MKHRRRREDWLTFLDARKPGLGKPIPQTFKQGSGIIRTLLIEINPVPPSKQTNP